MEARDSPGAADVADVRLIAELSTDGRWYFSRAACRLLRRASRRVPSPSPPGLTSASPCMSLGTAPGSVAGASPRSAGRTLVMVVVGRRCCAKDDGAAVGGGGSPDFPKEFDDMFCCGFTCLWTGKRQLLCTVVDVYSWKTVCWCWNRGLAQIFGSSGVKLLVHIPNRSTWKGNDCNRLLRHVPQLLFGGSCFARSMDVTGRWLVRRRSPSMCDLQRHSLFMIPCPRIRWKNHVGLSRALAQTMCRTADSV